MKRIFLILLLLPFVCSASDLSRKCSDLVLPAAAGLSSDDLKTARWILVQNQDEHSTFVRVKTVMRPKEGDTFSFNNFMCNQAVNKVEIPKDVRLSLVSVCAIRELVYPFTRNKSRLTEVEFNERDFSERLDSGCMMQFKIDRQGLISRIDK